MALTKVLNTIIPANTVNAAGATTTGTSVEVKYGTTLTIKITNGATAPTLPANAYIYTSGDNVNWKFFTVVGGPTGISGVNEFPVIFGLETMYVNVVVKDNTGQSVTCETFAQVTTAI